MPKPKWRLEWYDDRTKQWSNVTLSKMEDAYDVSAAIFDLLKAGGVSHPCVEIKRITSDVG